MLNKRRRWSLVLVALLFGMGLAYLLLSPANSRRSVEIQHVGGSSESDSASPKTALGKKSPAESKEDFAPIVSTTTALDLFERVSVPELSKQTLLEGQKAKAKTPVFPVRISRGFLKECSNIGDVPQAFPEMRLNLIQGAEPRVASIQKTVRLQNGSVVLEGHIDGDPWSFVSVSVDNDKVLAYVHDTQRAKTYLVEYYDDGLHRVYEPDSALRLPCAADNGQLVVANIAAAASEVVVPIESAPAQVSIDAMIVYTPAARNWMNNQSSGVNNVINLAMSLNNQAHANSLTGVTVNLVHTEEVAYTESSTMDTDLNRLTNTSDGYIDSIHSLRNRYGADLVCMFEVNNDNVGGLGWLPKPPSSSTAQYGFCCVYVGQASWTDTLAHEWGHNMGCAHNRENASTSGAYSYSYGWRWLGNDSKGYCDVMAYSNSTYTEESHYFSNPDLQFKGAATGVAIGQTNESANAQTIILTAPAVANYRASVAVPANITDLSITGQTVNSLTLSFTTVGNVGNSGTASSYDVRVSSAAITESNWASAAQISGEPAPIAAGQAQSFSISNLQGGGTLAEDSTYYVGIKVVGSSGTSTLSNVVSGKTADATAPAKITSLAVTLVTQSGAKLTLSGASSSGDLGSGNAAAQAADSNTSTFWSSPARNTAQEDWLQVDLGSAKSVARVRLLGRSGYPQLFPAVFTIEVGDGVTFSAALMETSYNAQDGVWYDKTFAPMTGRYVRIRGTDRPYSTIFATQISEFEVYAAGSQDAHLAWTAPGDNGSVGTASSYLVRYRVGAAVTDANWNDVNTKTFGSGIPTPAAAGTAQSMDVAVSGLTTEASVFFGMRAIDEASNQSLTSNSPSLITPGVAPAAVSDLTITGQTPNSLTVRFTAPGDDGNSGTATSYEIRVSTTALTSSNWASATQMTGLSSPQVAGTLETITLNTPGLSEDTTYYVGVKAIDEVGNSSALSNVVSGKTADATAPGKITTLAASLVTQSGAKLVLSAASSSGDLGSSNTAAQATDGSTTTFWSSPARSSAQEDWLQVDLGSTKSVARVRLLGRNGYPQLFPSVFTIEVGDGVTFAAAQTETSFSAQDGVWYDKTFTPKSGRYVRIRSTDRPYSTIFATQIAEFEVYSAGSQSARLTWTAPGDNGSAGTASSYLVRYRVGAAVTDANWADVNTLAVSAGIPTPSAAGSAETMDISVSGLPGETMVFFGVRAVDEANNQGLTSNSPSLATPGVVPGAVSDLSVIGQSASSLTVRFTATGDDGMTGTATSYDIRISTSALSEANWASATQMTGIAVPQVAGTVETRVLNAPALSEDTIYYVGVKVLDEVGNTSALSNVVSGKTSDATAPGKITNLAAALVTQSGGKQSLVGASSSGDLGSSNSAAQAADGNTTTFWSSPARSTAQEDWLQVDLGSTKSVARVRLLGRSGFPQLFPSALSIEVGDGVTFAAAQTETSFNAQDGVWYDKTFTPKSGRYVRIRGTDRPYSNIFAMQIAEFEVYSAGSQSARLTWTAPGDNGSAGTSSSYLVRYRVGAAVTDANWADVNTQTVSTGIPTPGAAGSAETMDISVSGLPGETMVFFGVRAVDEAGNQGLTSNSPSMATPGVVPGAVSDLSVIGQSGTSLTVRFTATGDDGTTGTATSYDIRVSTSVLSEANWAGATQMTGIAAPQVAGTVETLVLNAPALSADTIYYVGIKVLDEVGNTSTLSNVVSGKTSDTTAPAKITSLAATLVTQTGGKLTLAGASSSGDLGSGYNAVQAIDGNTATFWSSPARNTAQEDWLQVDLGSTKSVARVRLLGRSGYPQMFPSVFTIEVGDGVTWTAAQTETSYTAQEGVYYDKSFTPKSGRYVRIRGTDRPYSTIFAIQIAEFEVYSANDQLSHLAWTAPGDNGTTGTATSYLVRYRVGAAVTDANWNDVNTIAVTSGVPVPGAAGTSEAMDISLSAISSGSTVYFAVMAKDEANNAAPASNSPSVTKP